MDTNDRQAIAGLFEKLTQVERQMPARDAEAERLIGEAIARQPGAPYYMAQTVVVQEHALNAAEARIAALEADLAEARKAPQGGGFFSGLFGGGAPRRSAPIGQPMPQGAPGGFLAGAAQTAMGVAGGMLLANAVAGMFAGEAQAGEPEAEPEMEDPGFDDSGEW
ncbi:DUF2076 domain-containing protein [Rhodobacter capsulatus]|uniref:DUF2076 domain-containing protein n=1 Tax=Rhodobacter capsulatus TaxID=1061 RepID=A0A4U1K3A2_RHOCA|nr:DUF2076 domain-containing protein [Rhodobacter capsulatus]TKD26596.1 DUF2076 domain-containing protein [Rhodobacter capsulatus]